MPKTIAFTKMHGCGNCYIYVDTTRYPLACPERAAVLWSDVHTGIGSDGLILIGKDASGNFTMRIFNADGSEGRMCGNGARCVGKFIYDKHLSDATEIDLHTLSGVKHLSLHVDAATDTVDRVTVDMGVPDLAVSSQCATADGSLLSQSVVAVDGKEYVGTFVSMGNPHFVVFVDDSERINLPVVGPTLEHAAVFPERCNIEFVSVCPDGTLRMRVWERGSGITMACGTGACATAVAACLTGHAGRRCRVMMDGGTLEIRWSESDGHIYMEGPATTVCEGSMPYEE